MANKTGSSSGSDNGDSHNSSLSSGSEEEQLRRLFNSCDADGDGFLDGEDLQFMCRMLNMSDSVQEVRAQLGLTEMSKISFQDFLHCRARVMLQTPGQVGGGGGAGGLQPQQYPNPHHMGVSVTPPPPTVLMSGANLPAGPSYQSQYQRLHQHYSPPGGVPHHAPISLPSSLYPYPHQPATDPAQSQHPCQHNYHHQHHHGHHHQQQPQYASVVPLNQRYAAPKLGPVMGGSGEDTGVESDATGGNAAAGHQLTSWPTLSSDSLGALSCPRPDSTDYDSGARDLSPEPGVPQPTTLTLSQLVERHDPSAFTQLREAGADSLLGIADRVSD
ncbi:colorectal mutant cancer protein isoform X1 [Elysia marginata]|uniref:Colorectal mutant cancer protein isoform X1 n=1 Tax=Elysia marginata TaxID=1093978 RepID=A0AAV4K1X7_9GAST|nr:colorectal mutant cancer protein isoform X1 [Elysia marginata]